MPTYQDCITGEIYDDYDYLDDDYNDYPVKSSKMVAGNHIEEMRNARKCPQCGSMVTRRCNGYMTCKFCHCCF